MTPDIELDVAGGRPCHRCDEPLILVARTSHPLRLADGSQVEGTRSVGLCAGCDRDAPDAQGLLAFFAVHETVTDETVTAVAALLAEWVDRVAHPGVHELSDETWCRGNVSGRRGWIA